MLDYSIAGKKLSTRSKPVYQSCLITNVESQFMINLKLCPNPFSVVFSTCYNRGKSHWTRLGKFNNSSDYLNALRSFL